MNIVCNKCTSTVKNNNKNGCHVYGMRCDVVYMRLQTLCGFKIAGNA